MRVGTARGLAGRCSADSLDAARRAQTAPDPSPPPSQGAQFSGTGQAEQRTKPAGGGMAAEETPDVSGATAAHAAAFTGDTDALIAMSKEDVALLRAKTDDGETPAYVP